MEIKSDQSEYELSLVEDDGKDDKVKLVQAFYALNDFMHYVSEQDADNTDTAALLARLNFDYLRKIEAEIDKSAQLRDADPLKPAGTRRPDGPRADQPAPSQDPSGACKVAAEG